MEIILTTTTKAFSRITSSVFSIDLIIILSLILLLIVKEFFMTSHCQSDIAKPECIYNERILYAIIIPFFYVFLYVLIYRILTAV